MATAPAELTATDYRERRSALQDEESATQTERSETAYRHAIGDAKDEELSEIRERLALVRDKIDGLDLAWQVAKAKRAEDYATARLDARATAAGNIHAFMAARLGATELADEALTALVSAWGRKHAAEDELADAIHPWIASESQASVINAIVRHNGADANIAARLKRAGIKLDWGTPSASLYEAGAMITSVENQNADLENRVVRHLPEMNEDAV